MFEVNARVRVWMVIGASGVRVRVISSSGVKGARVVGIMVESEDIWDIISSRQGDGVPAITSLVWSGSRRDSRESEEEWQERQGGFHCNSSK